MLYKPGSAKSVAARIADRCSPSAARQSRRIEQHDSARHRYLVCASTAVAGFNQIGALVLAICALAEDGCRWWATAPYRESRCGTPPSTKPASRADQTPPGDCQIAEQKQVLALIEIGIAAVSVAVELLRERRIGRRGCRALLMVVKFEVEEIAAPADRSGCRSHGSMYKRPGTATSADDSARSHSARSNPKCPGWIATRHRAKFRSGARRCRSVVVNCAVHDVGRDQPPSQRARAVDFDRQIRRRPICCTPRKKFCA